MTAVNIIRQTAAVHILTDGEAYRADGTSAFRTAKVFPLLHLDAAVASRGSPLFAPTFAFRASTLAKTFDHLKALALALAMEVLETSKDAMAAAGGIEFDLAIAGFSETKGPNSYFICNHENHGAAVPPWEIVELSPLSLAPTSKAIDAELEKAFPNGVHPDQFNPVVDGLRVLEIQRAHPVPHAGGGFGIQAAVGAFAQLATITPGAITMKIIRRWPDEIGRPLAAG
jgi:hypothetical protein